MKKLFITVTIILSMQILNSVGYSQTDTGSGGHSGKFPRSYNSNQNETLIDIPNILNVNDILILSDRPNDLSRQVVLVGPLKDESESKNNENTIRNFVRKFLPVASKKQYFEKVNVGFVNSPFVNSESGLYILFLEGGGSMIIEKKEGVAYVFKLKNITFQNNFKDWKYLSLNYDSAITLNKYINIEVRHGCSFQEEEVDYASLDNCYLDLYLTGGKSGLIKKFGSRDVIYAQDEIENKKNKLEYSWSVLPGTYTLQFFDQQNRKSSVITKQVE